MKLLNKAAVPIDTIQPHPSNVRHGDIGAICQSLETHGQYQSITVQLSTGNIIRGNHTWHAMKQLSWDKCAVQYIDVTDDQALRIMLVDNRTSDLATNNEQDLADLLTQLALTDDQLTGTGFDGDDLDVLLADLGRDGSAREGELIEPPETPTTKLGDVWALGEHRLTCGDAFEVVLEGDAIVTDPPYGMRLDTDYTQMPKTNIKAKKYRPVIGDDQDFDPTPLFIKYEHVKEQLWFGADYYRQHLPGGGSWLVWDKRDTGDQFTTQSSDRMIGSQFELIWTRTPRHRTILRFLWAGFTATEGVKDRRVHPTQKPVALMEQLVGFTEGIVLDPFAGSGSTLIACENLGRICHAVELDPAYCDVIIERFRSINPTATIEKVD